jgi:hypothetical protein
VWGGWVSEFGLSVCPRKENMRGLIASTCFSALLLTALTAQSSPVTYDLTNVGGDVWRYDYSVENVGLSIEISEITVYFDQTLFSDLALVSVPLGWDGLVVQPDPNLPSDGFFDALALAGGIPSGLQLAGFAASARFNGVGIPGNQRFELYDADFHILAAGQTTPIPEPSPLMLMFFGALVLYAKTLKTKFKAQL